MRRTCVLPVALVFMALISLSVCSPLMAQVGASAAGTNRAVRNLAAVRLVSASATAAMERGREIYEERCIRCHGPNGTGTKDAPAPIFGDRPTSDLADVISRTMPEDAVGDCVGDDARAVAEWMQSAFYSPEAQARLNPPRIELSRLTVSQYRNAIADLGASFRWFSAPKPERGLKAQYFASRGQRGDRKVYDRIDSKVDFNFGAFSPDGEKIPE